MTDRSIAPGIKAAEEILLREPEKIILGNGIPLYVFNAGEQDVVQIEVLFRAGSVRDNNFLVAGAASELLDEGTLHHSATEIADTFEFYGAFLDKSCGVDFATVKIVSLTKFLGNVLPMFAEIISEPAFPEPELKTYKTQNKQRLQVNNNKVEYVARKYSNQKLFGQQSAYGYYHSVEDYDRLERNALAEFHKKFYPGNVFAIIIAGRADETVLEMVSSCFGTGFKVADGNAELQTQFQQQTGKFFIPKSGSVQSGIRLSKLMFTKAHPDFVPMFIASTLLGGYFGSRLMSNIREEKGFTYGIGSGMASLEKSGYFFIATEVGSEFKDEALKEIYYELHRLQTEPVPGEELQLVRNYLSGSFQRGIDGPFSLANRLKSVLFNGLDFSYYRNYLFRLNTFTSDDVLNFSKQYFNTESFTEVVVG